MVERRYPWFRGGTACEIFHPGTNEKFLTLDDTNIIDHAKVRWGRSSLFQAPSNRTLDVTLWARVSLLDLQGIRACHIRLLFRNHLLFEGQIDSITPNASRDLIRITATETPTWKGFGDTDTSYFFEPMTPELAREKMSGYYGLEFDPLPMPVYPRISVPSDSRYQFTDEQMLRLGASPYPASFVQWMPGLKRVGTTMASMTDELSVHEIDSSEAVEFLPHSIRLEDTPFTVALQSERAWFPDLDRAAGTFNDVAVFRDFVRGPKTKTAFRFEQGMPYDGYQRGANDKITGFITTDSRPRENVFFHAADMIRGQITSPITARFHDLYSYQDFRNLRHLFSTWESRTVWLIRHSLFGSPQQSRFRAIGGTLDIGRDRTTHTVTLVWSESHPRYGFPNDSDMKFLTSDGDRDWSSS